jgi:hypothetical protein
MKKLLYAIILIVILAAFFLIVTAKLAGANADEPASADQHRPVVFFPILLQQCRTGYNCAVVEPTPQAECDLKYWWECP